MKIDAELKKSKDGKSYYIYIPVLKKFVFLQGIELDYLLLLLKEKESADKKSN